MNAFIKTFEGVKAFDNKMKKYLDEKNNALKEASAKLNRTSKKGQ